MAFASDCAISSTVLPIASVWSSRTFVMTPMVARTISRSLTHCRSGRTAMHSATSARAPVRLASRSSHACSRMLAGAHRLTGCSEPSARMSRAAVPVVFASVGIPASRNAAATSRVTVDLPRVPLTWMRIGTAARARRAANRSSRPSATSKARQAGRTIGTWRSLQQSRRYGILARAWPPLSCSRRTP